MADEGETAVRYHCDDRLKVHGRQSDMLLYADLMLHVVDDSLGSDEKSD